MDLDTEAALGDTEHRSGGRFDRLAGRHTGQRGNAWTAGGRWARRAVLAVLGLGFAPGAVWACERGEDLGAAGVLHLSRCEPFARAMWLPSGASGVSGNGTRYPKSSSCPEAMT